MKKLFILIAALSSVSLCVFAQDKSEDKSSGKFVKDENTVLVNKFDKNWEISIAGGVTSYIGEYSGSSLQFKDWWGPAFEIGVQKWASPYFGIGLEFTADRFVGLYAPSDNMATYAKPDDPLYGGAGFHKSTGWYCNTFIKGSLDFTNLIWKLNPKRIYSLIGYIGGGVMVPFNANYTSVTASFNAGLNNRFRVCKNLSIDLNIKGAIIGDDFNGISYYTSGHKQNVPVDGSLAVTLGLTYKFAPVKKSGKNGKKVESTEWVPFQAAVKESEAYTAAVKEAEQNQTRAEAAEAKLAEKENGFHSITNVPATAPVSSNNDIDFIAVVKFDYDSSAVSVGEKLNVLLAANAIKKNPGVKFAVIGYADKQTGTTGNNMTISLNRAQNVRKMLVEEFGVNASQLVVEGRGGVDYMYLDQEQYSRIVIVKPLENK